MASENFFNGNIVTALAAGIGATLLAPVLVPILTRAVKPLTKGAIKGGILFYEKGRESFAELSETVDDLVAEAKVEMESGAASASAVASSTQAASGPGREAPPPARPAPGPDTPKKVDAHTPVQPGQASEPAPVPRATPANGSGETASAHKSDKDNPPKGGNGPACASDSLPAGQDADQNYEKRGDEAYFTALEKDWLIVRYIDGQGKRSPDVEPLCSKRSPPMRS